MGIWGVAMTKGRPGKGQSAAGGYDSRKSGREHDGGAERRERKDSGRNSSDAGSNRERGGSFKRERGNESFSRQRGRESSDRQRGEASLPRDSEDGAQRDLLVFGKNTIVSYLERMDEEEEPSEQAQEINKIFLAEGGVIDERVRKIKHLAGKLGIPVVNCHSAKLDNMVPHDSRHQGVVAQISPIKLLDFAEWLERLLSDKENLESSGRNLDGYLIVALDGIEDPRNVGAIIRSAESQGVKAILIPERRAAQVTDTVAKTSAGAIAHIPIVRIVNTVRALEELKEHGFWVMGLAADAPQPLYRMDLKRPLVIVVGSEGKGLRPLVVSTCDLMGSIPLPGKTESLNASVALGIAVYEAVRQNTSNI